MESNGRANKTNSSAVLFRWRIADDTPDKEKPGWLDEEWRKYDKLTALIFCLFLTSFYDCGQSNIYRGYFQSYQTRCIEIVALVVVTIATYAIMKVRNPDIFYYKEEPQQCLFRACASPPSTDRAAVEDSGMITTGVQTDTHDYAKETLKQQRRYRREMVRLSKMRRLMKRKMSHQWKDASKVLNDKRHNLADLQLQLLPLHNQKTELLNEKEVLETQLKEERRRNDDLAARIVRVNQQTCLDGAAVLPARYSGYTLPNDSPRNSYCDRVPAIIGKTSPDTSSGDAVRCSGMNNTEETEETCATHAQSIQFKQPYDKEGTQPSNGSILRENIDSSKPRDVLNLPDSTTGTDCRNMLPVRILYATVSGYDGFPNYQPVTSDMYHVYTEGAGLLPTDTIGQMEVIAEPQRDGTLKLQYVKQYVSGFPADRLNSSDQYQTYEEFRRSLGAPVPADWSPSDVQFITPL